MTFTEQLQKLGACSEAIEWVNGRSLQECWQVADRADWMLWLADKVGIDKKPIVLASCDCAETVMEHVPDGEDSPRIAIETGRLWCDGKATLEEVEDAADAASYAAADAASSDYAAYSAASAAADAANAAAYAVAASAAAFASSAVYASGASGAAAHKTMSTLVRNRITVEMIEERLKEVEG